MQITLTSIGTIGCQFLRTVVVHKCNDKERTKSI